ncbi:RraA family protein [Streptomyces sp. 7N604]|uniref:RraA family protein n=1 Tax=Streptomyces sp. 7N604 TaxID=3457415 RepID=UPI003FCFD151
MTADAQPHHPAIDLTEVRTELNTALLSDILDDLGHTRQCLEAGIAPIAPDQVLAGFAFSVLIQRVYDPSGAPYEGVITAVDELSTDDVVVIPTGRATDFAVWGELLSAAAHARGAAGVLTDGLVRDTRAIRALGLPVLAGGSGPRDSKGRQETVAHRVAVRIDGVRIEPGDLVFGDADGAVVIPCRLAEKVVAAALDKARAERGLLRALTSGTPMTKAFKNFGVL